MASNAPKVVAYLRVSTARQGRSGLGIEAQREAVRVFVASQRWQWRSWSVSLVTLLSC